MCRRLIASCAEFEAIPPPFSEVIPEDVVSPSKKKMASNLARHTFEISLWTVFSVCEE